MNERDAKALRGDMIGKMLELDFYLACETQVIPDITENPETILQFRRSDNAEVHIVIKR